jgi:hypothetical protein
VQGLLDVELVRAQHHHVDIAVIADWPPDGELDCVPAGDPPRAGHRREDLSGFRGLRMARLRVDGSRCPTGSRPATMTSRRAETTQVVYRAGLDPGLS